MLNPRTSITIDGLVNAGSSFTNLATINVINQTALDSTASGGSGAAMVFAPQGSWNAILRANITGILPVELMAFDVE